MSETAEQRSSTMRAVRSRDTNPELAVRRLLHSLGYRYRLHVSDLPGKPDIVFPKKRKVVFVHGCFWHKHTCRRGARSPSTRQEYWVPKLERNARRDELHVHELDKLGWKSLVIWECEANTTTDAVEQRLKNFLEGVDD